MNEMTPEPADEDLPPYFHDPADEPEPERPEPHLGPEEGRPRQHLGPEEADD